MKKLLAILLATMMVFSIVACGNKDKQGTNDDEKYKDTTVVVDSVTICDKKSIDFFRFFVNILLFPTPFSQNASFWCDCALPSPIQTVFSVLSLLTSSPLCCIILREI